MAAYGIQSSVYKISFFLFYVIDCLYSSFVLLYIQNVTPSFMGHPMSCQPVGPLFLATLSIMLSPIVLNVGSTQSSPGLLTN